MKTEAQLIQEEQALLTFRPSPEAATLQEVSKEITAIAVNGINSGQPTEATRKKLQETAAALGWTEALYIEKGNALFRLRSDNPHIFCH